MIIHNMFEDIATGFPEAPAVIQNSRCVTYSELNAGANRIAGGLIENGVATNEIVGLYFDASIEYIAAVLGVLKAGGIFLPFNRRFPEKRLDTILNKTKPRIFITGASLESEFSQQAGGYLLAADVETTAVIISDDTIGLKKYHAGGKIAVADTFSADNPRVPLTQEDGGYIMTTSGSTGEPRIILGSNRGLSHFIRWEIDEFKLGRDVRVSLLAPVTFDVSLRDIFVPLVAGGTVCIPDDETRHNPARLFAWLQASRITLMHIIPSLFRLLTKEIKQSGRDAGVLSRLKYVLIAGEPLYGDDVLSWRQAAGDSVELVNLYGPSETTLAKMFYRVGNRAFKPDEIVPIGKPLPDTEILIIKDKKLCRVGETGEIYIRTPFRSRGYYDSTGLNETDFVSNPVSRDPEDIVYKTGDQGRYMTDGNVQFEGRLDEQVKLYGNRVEISEIEFILRQHPQVRDAAVTVRPDNYGNPRLAGYIVPLAGSKPAVEALRRFVAEYLPDYMIPAVFVMLKKLPLTHNDKIDRRALPDPGRTRPEMEQDYAPPATDIEKALDDIWRRVLALERVGMHDNFFDLGGTSLLAVNLVALINRELGIELPIVKIFQYPNISLLVGYLGQTHDSRPTYERITERARKRRESLERQKQSISRSKT